jgi:hypothetical protein
LIELNISLAYRRVEMKKPLILCTSILFGITSAYGAEQGSVMQESYLEMMPIDKFVESISLDELLNVVVTEAKVEQKN